MSSFGVFAQEPLRERYSLNDGWMVKDAEASDAAVVEHVTLPHTWDVAVREGEMDRGTMSYSREIFIPVEWQKRRVFIRFGGAQSVAEVFVNGRYVGAHHGGFSSFTFELTDKLRYGSNNYLRVMVSNSHRSDVLPVSTDMTCGGGLYRGVELLVTGQEIISPLYYGCEGVIVEQAKVDANSASGVVKVYLSTKELDHVNVNMRIVGEDGYEVVSRSVKASKISPERAVELPFSIAAPQLWSPDSPVMYDVEVSVGDLKSPLDRVVVRTGFRSVAVNDDNQLCINGCPVAVRGVNYGHDRHGYGMALDAMHLDEDCAMIDDMGANAIRSLVGPHDGRLYDWCDSNGMLVWVDMPNTRSERTFSDICYYPHEAFRNNGFEQLTEIIMQNYNHPSVVMWGLFSLVWQRGDDVVPYVEELNTLAHKLDASRLTVGCSNVDGDINFVTDLVVLRQDVGWMKGSYDDVSVWCKQLTRNKAFSELRSGVCYGEAGVRGHNAEHIERATRTSRLYPERRQREMHERYIDIIETNECFWGVWLDNMFDYASWRSAYGMNLAGMVEHDHKTTKDVYHLYRARWNGDASTMHIADRGWRERRDTLQRITVYSSVGAPRLVVGADTIATSERSRGCYVADSVVVKGVRVIRAVDASARCRDSIMLRVGSSR